MVAEPGDEARPQPVGDVGELLRVQHPRERAHHRHHSGGDHPGPGHHPAARGRAGLLGLRVQDVQRGQFGLVPAFAVGGEEPVQFLQPPALGGELAADLRHRLRHTARAVVDVRRQRAPFAGDLLQLP
ncbi:hypothetical protein [Streptomyces luteogriseus]|uniref:hypothetical protein n=1 Tax=Streptomyces luteogriseus TaxID=68233 RepID=UPI0027D8F74A|nr:hypothetical protein [Streptomyces luteogriseus]